MKEIIGPLLYPLQFADRANRSVDDAVNMGLHYVLQHLDRPGTYVRILFVDFSSAFNTIVYTTMFSKRFAFTHIRKNGRKHYITYARPVVGAVTLLVNSTCR